MDIEATAVHRCALPQRVPQVSGSEGLAPPGMNGDYQTETRGQRFSGHDGARKHTHCFLSSLIAGLLRTFDMVQMLRGSHCAQELPAHLRQEPSCLYIPGSL